MDSIILTVTPVAPAVLGVTPLEGTRLSVEPAGTTSLQVTPGEPASLQVTPQEGCTLTVGEVCSVSSGTLVVLAASDGPLRTRDGGYLLLNPATNPPEN